MTALIHCQRGHPFDEHVMPQFGKFAQGYECSFTAMEGLVYPKFYEQTHTMFTAPPGSVLSWGVEGPQRRLTLHVPPEPSGTLRPRLMAP